MAISRRPENEIREWVKKYGYDYNPARFIGIEFNKKLVGALVYWRFQYEESLVDTELTFILERPQSFTKSLRYLMLAYPFDQLGSERVTARIGIRNQSSLKIAENIGFKIEGYIRRGKYEDQYLLGVLKDEFHR